MAEIKSTMEIIMEKTKGLTLSEEEKEAYREKDTKGKVRGLLQKFFDSILSIEKIKTKIYELDKKQDSMPKNVLIKECLSRIGPDFDNLPLFDILEQVACVDTTPFRELLAEFNHNLDEKKSEHIDALRNRLEKDGIFGTALVPNMDADPKWSQFFLLQKEEFQEKLNRLIPLKT